MILWLAMAEFCLFLISLNILLAHQSLYIYILSIIYNLQVNYRFMQSIYIFTLKEKKLWLNINTFKKIYFNLQFFPLRKYPQKFKKL